MKVCTKCGVGKPVEAFHNDKAKRDGRHSHCRQCLSEYYRERRINDPDFVAKCRERSKKYRTENREKWRSMITSATLYKKYGITLEEFRQMSKEQGDVCLICEEECNTGHRLSVDHDHTTGKVRGLLCRKCNNVLGHAGDNPEILRKAIQYLERN